MPIIDKSPLLEAAESLNAYREDFNKKQQRKLEESAQAKAAIDKQRYFGTKYHNEMRRKDRSLYTESLKNELLGDAIKGIYIGALMENKALTEDGLALADHLVDNYIKESGGATNILRKMKGKTYALDYIRCCVEGTYDAILEADDDEEKKEDKDEEKSKDNQIEGDDSDDESSDEGEENQIEDDEDNDSDDEFDSITKGDDEDDEDTDSTDDSDDNESEGDAEPEEDSSDDSGEDEAPEEPEGDEEDSEDIEDDVEEDIPEETPEERQKMMDDLSQDEDIKSAVDIIAHRCADAEEEFIKKNNEDKKAIEDIASRVADRINGSEGDASTSDEEAEEVKEEATRIGQQETNKYNERRVTNVYEHVVYNLTSSIVKDKVLRENYTEESGKLDMYSVMESAYCIYGLLETVNTLQLENVTPDYIQKALSTM